MNATMEGLVTIMLAITGVAVLAVLVSKNSNTAEVIQAAASGYANDLGTALSPVTGASYSINTSYPGQSNGLAFG